MLRRMMVMVAVRSLNLGLIAYAWKFVTLQIERQEDVQGFGYEARRRE